MTPEAQEGIQRAAAKAGTVLSALAVFACGWLAMQSDDWRWMVGFTLLAIGAMGLATAFARRRNG